MKDSSMTTQELIAEIPVLKKRIQELEQAESERKRAEEALTESKGLFKTYLENAPDAVYLSDVKGNFLYGNRKCEEIIGYRREELIGKNFLELNILPEKSLNKAIQLLQANIEGKSTGPDEIELINKEGCLIPVEINTSVIQRMGQGIVLAFVRDITDRKRAEELLRESETCYRELFDNISSGVAIYEVKDDGNDFIFKDFNKAGERLDGDRKEDIVGKSICQVRSGIKEFGLLDVFKRVWKTGIPEHYPASFYEDEKIKKWFENYVYKLPTGDIVTVYDDVTERKRTEEAQHESEIKLQAIFDTVGTGIIIIDRDTQIIIEANQTAIEMTGRSPERIIGQICHSLVCPAQAGKCPVKDLGQSVDHSERKLLYADGHLKDILKTVYPITIKGRNCYLESFIDISDRKRMEEALKESEQRYRELSIVDDLTQLYNSRHFYFQLKIELDRSNRYGQPLTLLLLDLDDFKAFNDAYGHVEGDQVLFRLGQVVKRCLRETDFAFRYGGEEFTILLPMTTSSDGTVTAERIRAELKKETFSPAPGQDVHVTVSIGFAQYRPQEDMKAFVHRVDQLMYQGKKNGKDRICSDS